MKKRFLLVSSAQMDFKISVTRLPREGEEISVRGTREYRSGGRGAAAALTFARLGDDCLFCGKTGNDTDGARLRQVFTKHGIDVRFLTPHKEYPTDFSVVISEKNGGSRTMSFPGASSALSRSDVEEAFTSYPDGVFLHPDIPEVAFRAAVEFATDGGIPLFTDLIRRRASFSFVNLPSSCCFDIIVLNSDRIREITDIEPTSIDNCLRSAIKLASIVKSKYYALRLGERGTFLYDNKYYQLIPGFSDGLEEGRETRAASDCFSAALSSEYLRTGQIVPAVRYASAVSAVCMKRGGGADAVPTAGQVNEFLEGAENGENQ